MLAFRSETQWDIQSWDTWIGVVLIAPCSLHLSQTAKSNLKSAHVLVLSLCVKPDESVIINGGVVRVLHEHNECVIISGRWLLIKSDIRHLLVDGHYLVIWDILLSRQGCCIITQLRLLAIVGGGVEGGGELCWELCSWHQSMCLKTGFLFVSENEMLASCWDTNAMQTFYQTSFFSLTFSATM